MRDVRHDRGRRSTLSKLLEKLLPPLPVARLCVPRIEVLTDFLEKGDSDALAPYRKDAPSVTSWKLIE